jgi:PIN domain nuclease of toxin-antitoxin system
LKLLLDTHIWVWSVLEPHRLSRRVQHALQAEDNELWLSPVSTWEVLMLHAKGRIRLYADPAVWISKAMANTREAPLTHEIALAAQQLPWTHQDPADRFLAATAQVLGLTLVTADERLLGLKDLATLPNR